MATGYSPQIVTNGLILTLDAANIKSYPGSGTVWVDLSGNANNSTLTNGPTFNSENGGSITFDGVDDYVNITFPTLPSSGGSIEMVIKRLDTESNSFAFSKVGTSTNRYYIRQLGTSGMDAVRGDPLASATFDNSVVGVFYHLTMVWNINTIFAYTNGRLNNSSSYTNPNSDISDAQLGFGPGQYANMQLARISIYNRTLTAAEVLQNYNATKGRFEL